MIVVRDGSNSWKIYDLIVAKSTLCSLGSLGSIFIRFLDLQNLYGMSRNGLRFMVTSMMWVISEQLVDMIGTYVIAKSIA